MNHRFMLRDRKEVMSNAQLLSVIVCPLLTEKSTRQSEQRQYFFKVADWANKFQIAQAIKTLFSVEVASVTTLNVRSRTRRFRGREGHVSGYKKAMVSLREGASIDLLGETK